MCVNLRQNIQNWPKGARIGQNCLVKSTAPPVVTYISYDLHRSGTPGISTILRLSGGCTSFQWWCWYICSSVVCCYIYIHFSGCVGTYIYILGAKSWRLATTALCSESFCTGGTVPLPLSYHSYQILIMHILGWYYLDQQ